jgi:hypothetical protein
MMLSNEQWERIKDLIASAEATTRSKKLSLGSESSLFRGHPMGAAKWGSLARHAETVSQ